MALANITNNVLTDSGILVSSLQPALNGTGFVKSTAGVISYDTNTYLTTISGISAGGELSGTYANPTLLNSAVIAKVLTGLNLTGGGTISATDSILTAFGKIQNQISALVGGVMYEGTWNASSNTPTIVSSVGTKGDYYIVATAGTTNINGITTWSVGDWIIFNGTTWDKVDNTDAVSSVNGFAGAVSLTTANISEVTNLYYTDTRARAAISLTTTGTSGAATYSGGVLNIPQYQAVLTNPVTGTGTTNTLPKFTGASTIGNSNITDTGSLITLNSNTQISSGGLGVGTFPSVGYSLLVGKNITGTTTAFGVFQFGQVQSDVTTSGYGFYNQLNTQAASFTTNYSHFVSVQGTIGAGSAITFQTGFAASSSLIGATNNYGFRGLIPSGSNRWNIYMDGTANNYMAGGLGIGSTSLTGTNLSIGKTITGSVDSVGVTQQGAVQSDSTNTANGFYNILNTQAASFTIGNYFHYRTAQGTIGAGSTVTNQVGFLVSSGLIGATNNYGFRGSIPVGTNRWNLYMDGTAANYLAGDTGIGSTFLGTATQLTVGGTETAVSAISRGQLINTVLVASANGDNLVGLDIAPTFNNGGFTGVNLYAIRASGNIVPSAGGSFSLGNPSFNFAQLHSRQFLSSGTSGFEFYPAFATKSGQWFTTGNLLLQNGGTFTDAGFRLDVTGTTRLNGQATITGSTTAASGSAIGTIVTSTLVASANNNALVGLDINPTFTNSGFANNLNVAIRSLNYAAKFNKLLIGSLTVPTLNSAVGSASGGTLPAATYFYRIVAFDTEGLLTTGSNELSVVTTGSTSSVALSWSLVQGAAGYRVYKSNVSNSYSSYISVNGVNTTTLTDTNQAVTSGTIPAANNSSYGLFDSTRLRTNNITLVNNGIGQVASLTFEKATDGASMNVVEYANDQTMYEFKLTDNPDGGQDFFHWYFGDWQNASSGWKPLKFGGFVSQIVSQNTNFWSSFSLPASTPYYTTNPDNLANATIKGDPYTSTTYNLVKDNGSGTGTLNVDVTGFTGTSNTIYWVTITSSTTFNWGIGSWTGTASGTNVTITGAFQALSNGIQIKLSASGQLAGDRWAFRAFPVPKMGIGTATPTAPFQLSTTVNATSALARASFINPTLVATANNDTLVGLDIAPNFNAGAFTGVRNIALRSSGDIQVANNVNINGLKTTGQPFVLVKMDTSDTVLLGNLQSNTQVYGVNIIFRTNTNAAGQIFTTTNNFLIQNGGTFTDAGFRLDVQGTARVTGVLTLSSTISNGTLTYTLPSATGTLALTSQIPTVAGVYLPLSGGTLTGALGGTSATFTGNLTTNGIFIGRTSNGQAFGVGNGVDSDLGIFVQTNNIAFSNSSATSGFSFAIGGSTRLSIASSGAATFSSSVQAAGEITTGSIARAFLRQTAGGDAELGCKTGGITSVWSEGAAKLSFAVGGAATFSSSVTAGSSSTSNYGTINDVGIFNNSPSGGSSSNPAYYGAIRLTGGGYDWGAIRTIQTNPSASWTSRMAFFTMSGAGGSLVERMAITNDGNVGIGTSSPANLLSVVQSNSAASTTLDITNSSNASTTTKTAQLLFRISDTANDQKPTASIVAYPDGVNVIGGGMYFSTRASDGGPFERMRITSGGNVLIGTADAGNKLDVNGIGRFVNGDQGAARVIIQNTGSGGQAVNLIAGNPNVDQTGFSIAYGNTNFLRFTSAGAATFSSSVTATSFFESSDKRLKKEISDNSIIDGIEAVKPKIYIKDGKEELGYYAQDLQEILPSAVSEGTDGFLSLSYSQVLVAKVASLEKRIMELEAKLK
jgi:hypothetical protein